MISLLKAFYGDAATKDNEFGYQCFPSALRPTPTAISTSS
jgi:hypothetical protein